MYVFFMKSTQGSPCVYMRSATGPGSGSAKGCRFQSLKKILMRVQLISLFLLLLLDQSNARILAQPFMSIQQKSMTLEQVFKEIHAQTGYNVLYSTKKLDDRRKLSLHVVSQPVTVVLDQALHGTPFSYTIKEKTILIKEKPIDIPLTAFPPRPGDKEMMEELLQELLRGRVTDTLGTPLGNATVRIRGTSTVTMTDQQGRFAIPIGPDEVHIEVSYVGYLTASLHVSAKQEVWVRLLTIDGLEEVVMVPYGVQRKTDLTGSVVSIKGDQLGRQAVHNPLQALSGITPGVEVLQHSGQPGNAISIRIRGGNSLLGSNEPLYVVDGFPISGSLENLNANDILSIEILKDASATAIYGSRGANGVVLVTTKKGVPNQSKVEYNMYYGMQTPYKKIDMLNAREFMTLANVRAENDKETPYFSSAEIDAAGAGTDWQDAIFRTKAMQNHSLMLSGGTERTTFGIAGNYLDQGGIILNSYFRQMQLRNTIEHRIFEGWKFSLNTILNRVETNILRSDNSSRGNGVLSGALVAPPTVPIRHPDGTYTDIRAYAFSPDIAQNPVMNALERMDKLTKNHVLGNAFLSGTLLDGLVLKTSIGLEYGNHRGDFYSPSLIHITATGDASIRYNELLNIVNENTLTYHTEIGSGHDLTVLGGLTSQQTIEQGVLARTTGFQTDALDNLNLQSGSAPGIPESFRTRYAILSGLGRVNYGFQRKYLLTFSLRADGSSRFGKENKWGYFPSAAFAWRMSEESFWEGLRSVANELKIRSSWGITGNTSVAPYQSLAILSGLTTVFDNNLTIGFGPGSNQPNPALKWETTTQVDFGLDLGLFNNRLSLTADYYYKRTNDLLNSTPVPLSTGYSSMSRNVGSVENKGLDIAVSAAVLPGPVKWDLGLNLSINRNKVLELAGGADIFGTTIGLPISLPVNLVREGHPIGVFYGYVEDGLTPDGAINYVDQDGNNLINTLDRTIIGDPNPDYILGLNTALSYKDFSLSAVVSVVQGNDIFNFNASNLADGFSFGINQIRDVLGNYWTPENPDPQAKYPKISKNTRYLVSDRFVEDGSYVRLRSLQLAYSLHRLKFGDYSLANSQVYLAGQNLLTWTKYSFYSPEVNTIGAGISKGVDQFGYPDARTVMLGIRLQF